jgi:hypothetical protein
MCRQNCAELKTTWSWAVDDVQELASSAAPTVSRRAPRGRGGRAAGRGRGGGQRQARGGPRAAPVGPGRRRRRSRGRARAGSSGLPRAVLPKAGTCRAACRPRTRRAPSTWPEPCGQRPRTGGRARPRGGRRRRRSSTPQSGGGATLWRAPPGYRRIRGSARSALTSVHLEQVLGLAEPRARLCAPTITPAWSRRRSMCHIRSQPRRRDHALVIAVSGRPVDGGIRDGGTGTDQHRRRRRHRTRRRAGCSRSPATPAASCTTASPAMRRRSTPAGAAARMTTRATPPGRWPSSSRRGDGARVPQGAGPSVRRSRSGLTRASRRTPRLPAEDARVDGGCLGGRFPAAQAAANASRRNATA